MFMLRHRVHMACCALDDRHALVLAAIVCEVLFILLNRKLRTPVEALPLSTLMCGFGRAVTTVPACVEQPWTRVRLES
jgi:hypothetical protein